VTKGELIRSIEGLDDETEVTVRAFNSSAIRFIVDSVYVKSRADEYAYVCLVIDIYPHTSKGDQP
jgi:hypothetical protein